MPAAAQRSVAFAKTTRPAIGAIAPRERLFARLDGSPGRTVAWISGPAGAGKTTLAASYVEARGHRCLWYQVDPDDADAATLFHYLAHAARKLDAGRAKDLPAFAPQAGAELGAFSRRFFRALFARAKGPFALVFDNLHAVSPGGALHTVLETAFSQVPKHCLVIVTSRSEPPASCARLRVTGSLVCVGWEDLRLDAEESAAIARLRGHEPAPEAMGRMRERTQGWAAGLVLLLEHAKLSGRVAELPGDAPPQVVFDYLAGEIFERFDAKTREFLLRIACLPRMTAEIAQSLSGEPKAARLLINLALNNYFVSEVQSEEGRSFQLHPLLRDFLRARAAQDLPEALDAEQLKRAAGLLRAAGHTDAAVSLLVEARHWSEVARVAAEEADALLAQGRSATLAAWLDGLPAGLLESDPRLLVAQGDCRVHVEPRAARRAYAKAFEQLRGAADAQGMLRCASGAIHATLLEFDDLTGLDAWMERARGLLAELRQDESGALDGLVAAMLWRDPGNAQIGAWLERASAARASEGGGPNDAVRLAIARALWTSFTGDLSKAAAVLQGQHASGPSAIGWCLASSLLHVASGRFSEGAAAAHAGLMQVESDGSRGLETWLRAASAAALLSAGDRDGARTELRRLDAEGSRLRRGDRALVHYLRGWLAALEGDAAGAQRDLKEAFGLALETGVPWLEGLARAALACVLAETGDRRGAEAQLRGSVALAQRLKSPWLEFVARLAEAATALECHDLDAAAESVRGAFALGREHGFLHAPGWRAREIAEMCVVALQEGIEPEYARSLVRARGLVPRQPPLRVPAWPWPYRIATLGRFELLRGKQPVEFGGKGPGRPLELLKLLVALGGQNVRADQLADALWPHVDADYAHKSFTATLHRLRKLLGDDEALVLRDARLSLNPALVWVDTWALEAALVALDDALRAPRSDRIDATAMALADELFALYRGAFLPDESEQPGFIACREQIRARLLRSLSRFARHWEEAARPGVAADGYLRCVDADNLFEAPYRSLMLLYQRIGDPIEARATYERLRTILAARLKTMPSQETQAVLAGLERSGAA